MISGPRPVVAAVAVASPPSRPKPTPAPAPVPAPVPPAADTDDSDEEAAVARAPGGTDRDRPADDMPPPPPDDEGAPWPIDEAQESAFRAEARERGESFASAAAAEDPEPVASSSKLPPLAELVSRLPPELHRTLDELFRARFYDVRRVKKRELKT